MKWNLEEMLLAFFSARMCVCGVLSLFVFLFSLFSPFTRQNERHTFRLSLRLRFGMWWVRTRAEPNYHRTSTNGQTKGSETQPCEYLLFHVQLRLGLAWFGYLYLAHWYVTVT